MKEIPLLTANDVELRVAQLQQTNYGVYATLLVYKDARTDFSVLNKVFGPLGWQRHHEVIDGNLYCTVEVWDEEHQRWISRQDVGIPSNTEAEKGAASDSFKRACFNFNIGVELYDAPTIRFKLRDDEVITGTNGKQKTYAKFFVKEMLYDPETGAFTKFVVVDKDNVVRYDINQGKRPVEKTNVESKVKKDTPIVPFDPPAPPADDAPWASDSTAVCSECGAVIKSPKVISYSRKKFGGIMLCYGCQQKRG